MIGLLLPLVLRLGVPERFAKPVAKVALIVAALALVAGGVALWLHFHDKGVIERHELEREASAGEARETAADERVNDAITNAKSEQELHDVIENAPKGGELSPAAHALACERLRRIGRIPPSCRPAGSDRDETAPD